MFFVWCFRQFLLDKFLTLGPEKDPTFQTWEMCRQFVRGVCQAKEKLPLLVAGCCSETEEPCQVHCVAELQKRKMMESPAEEKGCRERKTIQSRRDLYSQPFPTGAKKAWEGRSRLGAGGKTHACLLHTGNACCLPGFNGPQPPPSCIPKYQQIIE